MAEANESLPHVDDIPATDGPSEQELLDAVMSNSPIMDELNVPLPDEGEIEQDPDESDYEDPEESEEAVSDEEEGEDEEEYEDEDGAEAPTQDAEVFTADDLDLEAQVLVKIDGEEQAVSFADLLKGYQTDASLSKKGRELGEARKELEEERAAKLEEIDNISAATNAMLSHTEQNLAKAYHDIEAQIKKAREDGDTFELGELKDKREQAQQEYWKARQQREGLMQAVEAQKVKQQEEILTQQLEVFQETIPSLIPDFDDKVALDIRDFALEHGIAENLLNSVVDPNVVKFIDDYRRLKQGVSKGKAKRKAVPAKKALPTKKAKPSTKKKQDQEKMTKARAFKDGASEDDQMAFLRNYASKSLNL